MQNEHSVRAKKKIRYEFDESIKRLARELRQADKPSIWFVTGDRRYGRTTFLGDLEKQLKNDDAIIVGGTRQYRGRNICECCYANAIEYYLKDAGHHDWDTFYRNIRYYGKLRRKALFKLLWIRKNRRSLIRNGCFRDHALEAAHFSTLTLRSFIKDFTVKKKYIFLIDNFNELITPDLYQDFSGICRDIDCHFILTVSPGQETARFYQQLAGTTDAQLRVYHLKPIAILPEKGSLLTRPPAIPGIINKHILEELSDEEILEQTLRDPYYSNVSIKEPMTDMQKLFVSLIHVLGGIRELEMSEIAKLRGGDPMDRLSVEQGLWKIEGMWKFMDGWREYLTTRFSIETVFEELEKFLLGITRISIENPEQLRTLSILSGRDIDFWLNPDLTKRYFKFFSLVNRLRKHKRFANAPTKIVVQELVDYLMTFSFKVSTDFILLARKLYEQTQNLNILDLLFTTALPNIKAIDHRLICEMISLGTEEALRWNDHTLMGSVKQFTVVALNEQLVKSSEIAHALDALSEWFGEEFNHSIKKENYLSIRPFIVHGHDRLLAFELKDQLQNTIGVAEPVILATLAGDSRTIIEKFEAATKDINLAFILITPDDIGGKLSGPTAFRARQNVIYEWGYLTSQLGRDRVILISKGKTELPSDMHGVFCYEINHSVSEVMMQILKRIEKLID